MYSIYCPFIYKLLNQQCLQPAAWQIASFGNVGAVAEHGGSPAFVANGIEVNFISSFHHIREVAVLDSFVPPVGWLSSYKMQ